MRLPHVTDLVGVDAAAVGIPFDTATSFRTGARFGPEAIRSASVLLRPYHPALEVDVPEALSVVDYGDLPVAPGHTEGTYKRIEAGLAALVDAGVFPLVLGGDHSITLAELRALANRHGQMALVQLDSHTDTWDEYFDQRYFHGTTFKRAAEEGLIEPSASVQAGMRGSVFGKSDLEDARALGFTVIPSEDLRALGPEDYAREVRARVGERPVFLSFDIDFLDPAFAPGTGTPEVAGFYDMTAMQMRLITVSPMKPHTTLGIAARSSITILSVSLSRLPQNSEMKIAAPSPIGTASAIATPVTDNVPSVSASVP